MAKRKNGKVLATKPAGDGFGVSTVLSPTSEGDAYMRQPCAECPWRKDSAPGAFPAEAYRISAHTCHDAAFETFACHMSGADRAKVCAGFLLSNSLHNIGVRLMQRGGRLDFAEVSDGGCELYPSYRAMAEANGVPPSDPALRRCRADDE